MLLEMNNLSVSYPEFTLHPVSFALDAGEMLTIVGESGSGKTTLARAIACLSEPEAQVSGQVYLNGRELLAMDERARRPLRMKEFALSFQNSAEWLNPSLTLAEHLREVLCRAYRGAAISSSIRAAMAAPSAVNQQPWEFYIARDETTRLALAASSPYGTPAKLAPCVIVACQRTEGLRAPQDAPYDMSASVENILIEAANLGLGAVWLGIAPEKDRMAAVDVALGSPRGVTPFALIAVGHPEHKPEPKGPTRYDETRVHWI